MIPHCESLAFFGDQKLVSCQWVQKGGRVPDSRPILR